MIYTPERFAPNLQHPPDKTSGRLTLCGNSIIWTLGPLTIRAALTGAGSKEANFRGGFWGDWGFGMAAPQSPITG